MACFPRVVDWIIPPLPFFHPSLIGFDILTLCPVTIHSLLYTYILLHWCSTDVKLVHCLTLVNGILAQSNKSISFKYAWVVWVLFSYSYHFPWEKHVQDAASTRRRDMERSHPNWYAKPWARQIYNPLKCSRKNDWYTHQANKIVKLPKPLSCNW